jgi:DNA helicase-2/ATP-dependent DNA helicase PcrA
MALAELNAEQQQIVSHLQGAVLALAPVGTGKTTVLAERLAHAVAQGFNPERMLCLTFTNRAARELGDRLRQKLPQQAGKITVKTFHALCAHILRLEAGSAGLSKDFVVYDDQDRLELLKELGIESEKDAKDLLGALALCKERSSDPSSLQEQFQSVLKAQAPIAIAYQEQLRQNHALDFDDLVWYTRLLFRQDQEVRDRWQNKYDLVQVDEVQDTNLCEYEILKQLASRTRNLAFIGDLDQTIYEWRGSDPSKLIDEFTRDFQPVRYSLVRNYRSTKKLLEAADGFAQCFAQRFTACQSHPQAVGGHPLERFDAPNEQAEGLWIAQRAKALHQDHGIPYHRMAVLTRTNYRSQRIASTLEQAGLPCITIESFEFFQRQEVKDALAYLKLLLNPKDSRSARRVLARPSRGIGEKTIEKIVEEGKTCGMHLSDLLQLDTFTYGEPIARLCDRFRRGKVVVFDVETTGLSPTEDEVVEIAAITLQEGKATGVFNEFIQNTKPVGDSRWVHGYSDDHLQKHGKPAKEVFAKFSEFTRGAILVGHNVGFDVAMVTAHARRAKIILTRYPWEDTWNLTLRLAPQVPNYKLETLCQHYHLPTQSTHRAMDDVRATLELLQTIMPELERTAPARRSLTQAYADHFQPLAQKLAGWRDALMFNRPAQLLDKILQESGLYDYYGKEPQRVANLKELCHTFSDRDNPDHDPLTSLRNLLEFSALAKNIDRLAELENRLPIITVHQSKGLEFDAAFIAGLVAGEFPSAQSIEEGREEEEKRLFYVALTRAKQFAFLSSYLKNEKGFPRAPSPFLSHIPKQCLLNYS